MGIVGFALKYRHTFYVLALMMLFLGGTAIFTTPKDIFPNINIPVVTVIWQYTGLTPEEMEARVTTYSEYSISSGVSGVSNIESQTLSGISVEKIYFQPGVNIDLAIAQIVSGSNSIRALMPTGIQPPIIVQFNASPCRCCSSASARTRSTNSSSMITASTRCARQLAPIPGITLPTPYGGKYRQIMVDLDPDALRARGMTPSDVLNAVNAESLTLPSGDAKLGDQQYIVKVNATAPTIDALNRIPIKQVERRDRLSVRCRACARRLGGAAEHRSRRRQAVGALNDHQERQRLDSRRRQSRQGGAARDREAAPPGMNIKQLFDQSVFVRTPSTACCMKAQSPPR